MAETSLATAIRQHAPVAIHHRIPRREDWLDAIVEPVLLRRSAWRLLQVQKAARSVTEVT